MKIFLERKLIRFLFIGIGKVSSLCIISDMFNLVGTMNTISDSVSFKYQSGTSASAKGIEVSSKIIYHMTHHCILGNTNFLPCNVKKNKPKENIISL